MKQLPWILVGLLAATLVFTVFFRGCSDSERDTSDTVWLPVRIDTLKDSLIQATVSEKPAGADTARLPVYRPSENTDGSDTGKDTVRVLSDSLSVEKLPSVPDSTASIADSADVIIPITEKEYRTDNYRIVVSGYRPELRSVELYNRTQTAVVTPAEAKKKRWGIGLSIGYGLSLSGRGEPFVGVTLNYNLLQW